jgi:hypothetical protein
MHILRSNDVHRFKDNHRNTTMANPGNNRIKMTFKYDDKVNFSNFEFDYQQLLLNTTIERIKDNEELMSEIKVVCEEELKEYTGNKLTLQNLIDLKIEDTAQAALYSARFYIDAEIDVGDL